MNAFFVATLLIMSPQYLTISLVIIVFTIRPIMLMNNQSTDNDYKLPIDIDRLLTGTHYMKQFGVSMSKIWCQTYFDDEHVDDFLYSVTQVYFKGIGPIDIQLLICKCNRVTVYLHAEEKGLHIMEQIKEDGKLKMIVVGYLKLFQKVEYATWPVVMDATVTYYDRNRADRVIPCRIQESEDLEGLSEDADSPVHFDKK